eukprot:3349285-Amphidinium_carterae.2
MHLCTHSCIESQAMTRGVFSIFNTSVVLSKQIHHTQDNPYSRLGSTRTSASQVIKQYAHWLQLIQEYGRQSGRPIDNGYKIATVINQVKGSLRDHPLLNMVTWTTSQHSTMSRRSSSIFSQLST